MYFKTIHENTRIYKKMKKLSLCVICARKGSKGLKNKNILSISGYKLFEISIIQAQKVKFLIK